MRPFNSLRRASACLRWYLVNMVTYMRGRSIPKHVGSGIAIFDLHDNVFHRYLLNFMLMLRTQGFALEMQHRPRAVGTWASNLLVRFIPELRIRWSRTHPNGALLFSDRRGDRHTILLDPDYFSGKPITEDTYRLPMSMVNTIYSKGLHRWMPDLNEVSRKPHVFFVGNLGLGYGRGDLEQNFGCFTRTRLFSILSERFRHRIRSPRSEAELFSEDPRDLILIDRKQFNIPHEKLRPTMARHDFFLAASGVVMPLCHNLVEAMSVGAIPVLQHPQLMHPPLVHGVNCMSFTDEAELKSILDEIPTLPDNRIMDMRRNVLSYYVEHLSPEAIVRQIRSMGSNLRTIRMNAEHYSVDLLRRSTRSAQ